MDLLKRHHAPVTPEAWKQIDDEAKRVLQLHLAGRQLVDFDGPHGWQHAAVNTGGLSIKPNGDLGVPWGIRQVTQLIELRVPFELSIMALDNASRGAVLDLEPVVKAAERIAHADAFFQAIRADLRHGGNQAYYSPASDHIQMPPFAAFAENVPYYSTLAHEHTHWTAPAARCDRELGKRFGDNAYAAEELIAELGAAFTCAHLGLSTEPREDHAQYIQSWLKVLKADNKAIFTAASKAQQATDWLIARAGESVRTAEVAE